MRHLAPGSAVRHLLHLANTSGLRTTSTWNYCGAASAQIRCTTSAHHWPPRRGSLGQTSVPRGRWLSCATTSHRAVSPITSRRKPDPRCNLQHRTTHATSAALSPLWPGPARSAATALPFSQCEKRRSTRVSSFLRQRQREDLEKSRQGVAGKAVVAPPGVRLLVTPGFQRLNAKAMPGLATAGHR